MNRTILFWDWLKREFNISPPTFYILDTILTEESGTKKSICSRAKSWAEFAEETIAEDNIKFTPLPYGDFEKAFDDALKQHFIFQVSLKNLVQIEKFHNLNDVEYITERLVLEHFTLTPLGGDLITQLRMYNSLVKIRMYNPLLKIDRNAIRYAVNCFFLKPAYECYYSYGIKRLPGRLNIQGILTDDNFDEYIVASLKENVFLAAEDNAEVSRMVGDVYPIKSWCDHWWNIHYGGFACKTQDLDN